MITYLFHHSSTSSGILSQQVQPVLCIYMCVLVYTSMSVYACIVDDSNVNMLIKSISQH